MQHMTAAYKKIRVTMKYEKYFRPFFIRKF